MSGNIDLQEQYPRGQPRDLPSIGELSQFLGLADRL